MGNGTDDAGRSVRAEAPGDSAAQAPAPNDPGETPHLFHQQEGALRRRRDWIWATFPALVPPIYAILHFGHGNLGAAILWADVVFGIGMIAIATAQARWIRREKGRVTANETGLFLDGRKIMARSHMLQVLEKRDERGAYIRLMGVAAGFRRSVDVEVADEEESARLLSALRIDGRRAVSKYSASVGTTTGLYRRIGVLGALASALVVGAASINLRHVPLISWPFLATAATLAMFFVAFRTTLTVSVGADGIRLARGIGRSRFIPYSTIREIRPKEADVEITFRNGSKDEITFGPRVDAATRDHLESFLSRVRERMAAHHGADGQVVSASLARGGRTTAEWVADLSEATDGAASFRVPALPTEVLLAVVEDETAQRDARAGAAVALRKSTHDPESRERIRIAAKACAEPLLRVALESAAASLDDEAVIDALDALHADDDRAPRSARLRRGA